MKKIFGFLSVSIATWFGMVSCTERSVLPSSPNGGMEYVTFCASLGDMPKTVLSGVQVHWQDNDTINVWYGMLETEMTGCEYYLDKVDGSDFRIATFNGFAPESDAYMAVYPASDSNECSKKGKLTVTVPVVQNVTSNSFARKANVAVAYAKTPENPAEMPELHFLNVGGLLALKVSSAAGQCIKSIRLIGTSAMTGTVEIKQKSISEGNPEVDSVVDGVNYIEFNTIDGGIIDRPDDAFTGDTGETLPEESGNVKGCAIPAVGGTGTKAYAGNDLYYAVVLPGTHSSMAITLVDDKGRTAVAKSMSECIVARNGNTFIKSIDAPDDASLKWKQDATVFINEIHTHNNQVELWNPNGFFVDVTGWLLIKDEKSWAFPVGSVIPARGYLVVTAGREDCSDGPMFGISGDKGFVLSLVNGREVDKVDNSGDHHAIIAVGETYGRKTDGGSEWVTFVDDGTIYGIDGCDGDNSKGREKGDEPVPEIDYTGLVINEVNGNDYNAENGNDKFIELYNGSANTLDLKGCALKKDGETVWTGVKDKHVLAPGTFLVLYSKKSEGAKTCAEENVFSSGISAKSAVRVQIQSPKGEDIDDFNYATYSGTAAVGSYGRNSDGVWYYQRASVGVVNINGNVKVIGLE